MSETALATTSPAPLARSAGFSLTPRNLTEAMEMAKLMANSDLVPKDFRDKPGNVLVAVQMGAELGLAPMQAIQNIAVVNGRPTVWGDAALALVKASPSYEWLTETVKDGVATCTIKRRGEPEPISRTFTVADAKQAGLFGKQGPWTQYPQRMLQLRARAFALRDGFPDVLKGLAVREEVEDYVTVPTQNGGNGKTAVQMPRRASQPAPPIQGEPVDSTPATAPPAPPSDDDKPAGEAILVETVTEQTGKKKNGQEWTLFVVKATDGREFATFSKTLAEAAREAAEFDAPMLATFHLDAGKTRPTLDTLTVAPPEA